MLLTTLLSDNKCSCDKHVVNTITPVDKWSTNLYHISKIAIIFFLCDKRVYRMRQIVERFQKLGTPRRREKQKLYRI